MKALKQAQYLRHFQYGLGVVTVSNAERTTIDFDLHGSKTFVTSLMQVELLPGRAPTVGKKATAVNRKKIRLS